MSSRLSLSPLLLGVVLLAGVVVYLNMPEEESASNSSVRATPVKTALVSSQAFPITIESLGTATANESVNITAQVTDTVRFMVCLQWVHQIGAVVRAIGNAIAICIAIRSGKRS